MTKHRTCIDGKQLRPQTKAMPEFRRHGDCQGCGRGPLHGPLLCSCSFLRRRLKLCRTCATAVDFYTQRWSRLAVDQYFEPKTVIELYELGRLILRRIDDA